MAEVRKKVTKDAYDTSKIKETKKKTKTKEVKKVSISPWG